jgi:dihydropyrimidinase
MLRLIRGGTVVTAAEMIKSGPAHRWRVIARLGADLRAPADAEVVDATGKLIMPGGVTCIRISICPCFDTVSSDDHYTVIRRRPLAAPPTVIDFVPQDTSPLRANIDAWQSQGNDKAAIDFGFT